MTAGGDRPLTWVFRPSSAELESETLKTCPGESYLEGVWNTLTSQLPDRESVLIQCLELNAYLRVKSVFRAFVY